MNMPNWLSQKTRGIWSIFRLAIKKFLRIDGMQWAGAFAFNAFFALFPLLVLLVTIASFFVDQDQAGKEVISYLEGYVPISADMKNHIFGTIAGVIKSRGGASMVALVILVWVALQCFTTLILATNRAWETEGYKWWRLPLKSLLLFGLTVGAILLGMAVPVLAKMVTRMVFSIKRLSALGLYPGGHCPAFVGGVSQSDPVLLAGSATRLAVFRSNGRRAGSHGSLAGGRRSVRDLPQ